MRCHQPTLSLVGVDQMVGGGSELHGSPGLAARGLPDGLTRFLLLVSPPHGPRGAGSQPYAAGGDNGDGEGGGEGAALAAP